MTKIIALTVTPAQCTNNISNIKQVKGYSGTGWTDKIKKPRQQNNQIGLAYIKWQNLQKNL